LQTYWVLVVMDQYARRIIGFWNSSWRRRIEQEFPMVTFGLNDVDLAIKSVGGQGLPDVIHASLMPWR